MIFGHFFENRSILEEQYRKVKWNDASGLSPEKLEETALALEKVWAEQQMSKSMQKASLFAFVLDHAQLAITPEELFQDHIRHGSLVMKQRNRWMTEVHSTILAEVSRPQKLWRELGIANAQCDFGHTVPDWYDILALGIPGLLNRLRSYHKDTAFYQAGEMVYEAVLRYLHRLSLACREAAKEVPQHAERLHYCADDLDALCEHEPQTLHQALQLTYIFHILQEEIEGERLRSLGGLDRIYTRFMQADLDAGRLTKSEIAEMWQDFFQKFHALTGDTFFGEPMYLGGELPDGSCAVNEYTYLILDAYAQLNLANPKFHIRISSNTPASFTEKVLDCIRCGNSSFVFINDDCAVPMMQKHVGATLEEAREYVPIGCYEPGILGREVACTGNGGISFPKALELTLNNGVDPLSGKNIGLQLGEADSFSTFDQLMNAFLKQLHYLTNQSLAWIRRYEEHYMEMNPSPLFSATMHECVERGMDAYEGGAKYNNSSLAGYGNGTVADALTIIRKYVYDDKQMTLKELNNILLNDWKDHELLRLKIRKDPDKWGNNRQLPDEICQTVCRAYADQVNSAPNGRGGHFKAAMYSIDHNYYYGKRLGASADGRKKGEAFSRNIGAASTMDRNGITAQIQSVTKLNHSDFPNGSVLDFMMHPSAVAGEEGLRVFYQLLMTYIHLGGYAFHGNIMDPVVLRKAQMNPEQYANLQVRVCGWNVYFVNLAREEQDEFIARAEQ